MEFKLKINELRKVIKLSQADLAEKLGLVPATISSWGTGNSYPSLDKLIELSKIFNVSTDFLLGVSTIADNQEEKHHDTCDNYAKIIELLEERLKDKERLIHYLETSYNVSINKSTG